MADFNAYPSLQIQNPNWGQFFSNVEDIRAQQNKNALFPLEQQQMQTQNELAKMQGVAYRNNLVNSLIGQAAHDSENSEDFDKRLNDIKQRGFPEVDQYIGKFNSDLRDRLIRGYGANGGNASGGGGGNNALAGAGGFGGAVLGPSERHDIGKMDRGQVQAEIAKNRDVNESMDRIAHSADPARAWEEEKLRLFGLGHTEVGQFGAYPGIDKFRELYDHVRARRDALAGVIMGVPIERDPLKIESGGIFDPYGELPVSGDTTTPPAAAPGAAAGPGATATAAPAPRNPAFTPLPKTPNYGVTGYRKTPEGDKTVYFDPSTGEEKLGTNPIDVGRYGEGRTGARAGVNAWRNPDYLVEIGAAPNRAAAAQMLLNANKNPYVRQQMLEAIRRDVDTYINANPRNAALDEDERRALWENEFRRRAGDLLGGGPLNYGGGYGGPAPAPAPGGPGPARLPSSPWQGMAGVPQQAIEALRRDPTLRSQFDQKYGAGRAAKVLGK